MLALPSTPKPNPDFFRDHLIGKESILKELGSHSLIPLHPGQLILHTMSRSLTQTQSQQLASLARLTHERHYDVRKYVTSTEILVPGGLVLGLTLSASSRDLHEILNEEIDNVSFLNSVHPGNVIGAISFIHKLDDTTLPGEDLESLRVRTIGLKNMNVVNDLQGNRLPIELFTGDHVLPKEIEKICKEKCPVLSKKIVAIVDRRIIRLSSHKELFLL
eukprot:812535_1